MSTAEPNRKDPNMSIAYTPDTDQSRPSRKVEVLDIRPNSAPAPKRNAADGQSAARRTTIY